MYLRVSYKKKYFLQRRCGHEKLISNGGGFKPAFAERGKKQAMIDLRGISSKWFKNRLCPPIRL
jgi:hypothetical protein